MRCEAPVFSEDAQPFAIQVYGSLLTELLRDFDTVEEIHAELGKMGYNIGLKSVEKFWQRVNNKESSFRPAVPSKTRPKSLPRLALK